MLGKIRFGVVNFRKCDDVSVKDSVTFISYNQKGISNNSFVHSSETLPAIGNYPAAGELQLVLPENSNCVPALSNGRYLPLENRRNTSDSVRQHRTVADITHCTHPLSDFIRETDSRASLKRLGFDQVSIHRRPSRKKKHNKINTKYNDTVSTSQLNDPSNACGNYSSAIADDRLCPHHAKLPNDIEASIVSPQFKKVQQLEGIKSSAMGDNNNNNNTNTKKDNNKEQIIATIGDLWSKGESVAPTAAATKSATGPKLPFCRYHVGLFCQVGHIS